MRAAATCCSEWNFPQETRHFYLAGFQLTRAVCAFFLTLEIFGWKKNPVCNLSLLSFIFMVFLGQNSSAGKLKTLSGALDIMTKTKGAFQLIRKELVAESEQVKEYQVA